MNTFENDIEDIEIYLCSLPAVIPSIEAFDLGFLVWCMHCARASATTKDIAKRQERQSKGASHSNIMPSRIAYSMPQS